MSPLQSFFDDKVKCMLKKFLSVLVLLLLSVKVFAAVNAANELVSILSSYKTLTADFTQITYDSNGAKIQTTNGSMALLRPGYFRWETLKPTKQIILTDGENLWVYDVGLEQVTIQPMKQVVGEAPASLLTDSTDKIIKTFSVLEEDSKKNSRWFVLKPKDSSSLYQTIKLNFQSGKLTNMNIVDNIGQKTEVKFKNEKINKKLNKNSFRVKIPKGTDVIGQAQ